MGPEGKSAGRTGFVKKFIARYSRDCVGEFAAESTYYFILGLIPFLIFLVNCILFFAAPHMGDILRLMRYLPDQFAQSMKDNIATIIEGRSTLWLVIGLAGAAWTASRGMKVLIEGIDHIYLGDRHLQSFVKINGKSLIFTVFLAASLIITLMLIVFANGIIFALYSHFDLPDIYLAMWRPMRFLIPFAMMGLTLAFFYRYAAKELPEWLRQRSAASKAACILGTAFLVTVLLLVLSAVYGYYILNISSMGVTYGSLLGLIFLILWFHLAAQIILTGGTLLMAWGEPADTGEKI